MVKPIDEDGRGGDGEVDHDGGVLEQGRKRNWREDWKKNCFLPILAY